MGLVNSRDDTERYRLGYPDLTDDPKLKMNVQFYKNEINSKPDGMLILNWIRIFQIIIFGCLEINRRIFWDKTAPNS